MCFDLGVLILLLDYHCLSMCLFVSNLLNLYICKHILQKPNSPIYFTHQENDPE